MTKPAELSCFSIRAETHAQDLAAVREAVPDMGLLDGPGQVADEDARDVVVVRFPRVVPFAAAVRPSQDFNPAFTIGKGLAVHLQGFFGFL